MCEYEVTEKISVEEIHKEIDLIQGCINRMAQNSFLIKGWMVTLFAVILALVPEKVEPCNRIFLGAIMVVIVIMFWYLDGFFLATEKNYQAVYSWVLWERPRGNRQLLYELNCKKYMNEGFIEDAAIRDVMRSPTLAWFYGIPLVVSGLYFAIQIAACCAIE